MKNMPFTKNLISVVLPVYNREFFIEECLQSVFNQSYQNFEIIIFDDGSTDNSYNICHSLAQKDKRIKLFKGNNSGVSAARNKILEKVQGEFVFFLDSDDVIHPALFESLINGINTHNADIAATNVFSVYNNNWHKLQEKLAAAEHKIGECEYFNSEQAINLAINQKSPLGCIGGVMMRTSLIGDTKFSEELTIGEDFYFIYQNLIKNATVAFLKPSWYYARFHQNNSSWKYGFDGFWTRFLRRKLVWESEEKFGRIKNANKQKSGAFYCFNVCIVKNPPYSNDSKKMRKVLRKYKKQILKALTFRGKLAYLISCYLPLTTLLMLKFLKQNNIIN